MAVIRGLLSPETPASLHLAVSYQLVSFLEWLSPGENLKVFDSHLCPYKLNGLFVSWQAYDRFLHYIAASVAPDAALRRHFLIPPMKYMEKQSILSSALASTHIAVLAEYNHKMHGKVVKNANSVMNMRSFSLRSNMASRVCMTTLVISFFSAGSAHSPSVTQRSGSSYHESTSDEGAL